MTVSDIDTARLESYLRDELGIDVVETELLSNKLNLSIGITTADEGLAYVLRRPNELRQTSLFNDLSQEYRVLQQLDDTTVPTQLPVAFCEDESVIGDAFLVTTYLDGATVPLGTDLPEGFQTPEGRGHVATSLIDTLADIHTLEVDPFDEFLYRRRPLEQVARASERLDEATSVIGRDFPTLRGVGDWLRENAPDDGPTALVHGDYRPGNVLFREGADSAITGVLDWETAMVGDPLTEMGYLLLRWRNDGDPTLSLDDLEARASGGETIGELRELNEHGLCPFSAKPGSPTRRELVDRYENATGIPYEHDRFYRAHAAFMLATVWADIHRRRIADGSPTDEVLYVDYMAKVADSIVTGEFDL